MTARDYFKHARSIGNFRAIDAWDLAKEAAEMDWNSYKPTPPASVGVEFMPDGSAPVALSFGIKVF